MTGREREVGPRDAELEHIDLVAQVEAGLPGGYRECRKSSQTQVSFLVHLTKRHCTPFAVVFVDCGLCKAADGTRKAELGDEQRKSAFGSHRSGSDDATLAAGHKRRRAP